MWGCEEGQQCNYVGLWALSGVECAVNETELVGSPQELTHVDRLGLCKLDVCCPAFELHVHRGADRQFRNVWASFGRRNSDRRAVDECDGGALAFAVRADHAHFLTPPMQPAMEAAARLFTVGQLLGNWRSHRAAYPKPCARLGAHSARSSQAFQAPYRSRANSQEFPPVSRCRPYHQSVSTPQARRWPLCNLRGTRSPAAPRGSIWRVPTCNRGPPRSVHRLPAPPGSR